MSKKVLVIGLDGGTWKIFDPLIKDGVMPNLKELVENGNSGICKSTYPPITAPAWASFQTGKNPGKHGIYDFIIFDKERTKDILVNYNLIKGHTIWDILTEFGKKSIVINVPLTYPTPKINGVIISGFPCVTLNENMVFPSNYYSYLINRGYKLFSISKDLIKHISTKKFVESQIETESIRYKTAIELLKNNEWDIFMVHNQCMDGLQHALLHRILDNKAEDWPIIKKFYKITDEYIGKLIEAVGRDTYIFILSDHGHTLIKKHIDLNIWLKRNGYLRNKIPDSLFEIYNILKKFKIAAVMKSLVRRRFKAIGKRSIFRMIKKEDSIAFSSGNIFGGIYMLSQKREYLNEIKEKLLQLKDDAIGKNIIKKIYEKHEIYNGNFIDLAPELLVEPEEGYTCGTHVTQVKETINEVNYKNSLSGTHDMEGIYCISGPGVKYGKDNISIVDFFPTILSLMNIPIPQDVDGKVLERIFNFDIQVTYLKRIVNADKNETQVYSDESEERIKKQLQDLGYL